MPIPTASVPPVRFGPFEVDFRAGELLKSGRRIRLQDQPLQVLAMLLEHPGNVVTRDEFRQKLWPNDTFVDFDHGLNNAINRLRDALNDSTDAPRFIETLPRRGYRFVAETNGAVSKDSIETGEAFTSVAAERAAAAKPSPVPLFRYARKFGLAAVGAVIAGAVILGLYFGREWRFGSNATMRIQSVAVLPLDNLSGDASQEYFADGMTDALTTYLAQVRGIRVISRTSAMHYKGTKKALPEIAKELGVDAVVEGSASRSNGVVHVNAQLIYAPGDSHIWAHSYEGAASRLAAMESEIANDLARRIDTTTPQKPSKDLSGAISGNPEAYELYLRAEPYYGLEARGKALALDPNLAEGYVSRGYLLWSRANGWSCERAVSDYRHALDLNPNLAEAHHQLANVYNHVGLLDKADEEIKKAVALDPLNSGIRFRVGINLLYQGKYDESLVELRDSEKFLPPFWAFQTSFALQHIRRQQEAQEKVDRYLKATPLDRGGSLTAMQALLAADAGDVTLAERKIQEATAKGKGYQHFHHVAYAAASAYALLNRPDQALQYLRTTADDGFPCYPLFEHDSNLDHLRSDPRFISFMAEQKRQWEYFRAHL